MERHFCNKGATTTAGPLTIFIRMVALLTGPPTVFLKGGATCMLGMSSEVLNQGC